MPAVLTIYLPTGCRKLLRVSRLENVGESPKIIALTDDRGTCIIANCEAFHMSIELDW